MSHFCISGAPANPGIQVVPGLTLSQGRTAQGSASAQAGSRGRPRPSSLFQDIQGRFRGRERGAGWLCESQALRAPGWADPSGWRRKTASATPTPHTHCLPSVLLPQASLLNTARWLMAVRWAGMVAAVSLGLPTHLPTAIKALLSRPTPV